LFTVGRAHFGRDERLYSRFVGTYFEYLHFYSDFGQQILEEHGFVISGTSPDNFFVEMIELPQKDHPFFLATQAHPEYKSRPLTAHPIFIEYLAAILKQAPEKKK